MENWMEDNIAFQIDLDFLCGVIGFGSLIGIVAIAAVGERRYGDAFRHANSHRLGLPETQRSDGSGGGGDFGGNGDCGDGACD